MHDLRKQAIAEWMKRETWQGACMYYTPWTFPICSCFKKVGLGVRVYNMELPSQPLAVIVLGKVKPSSWMHAVWGTQSFQVWNAKYFDSFGLDTRRL